MSHPNRENDQFMEARKSLLFHHPDYPESKYSIQHPFTITSNCDVLLVLSKPNDEGKTIVFPVHKQLLKIIPYYDKLLNEDRQWKELQNKNGCKFIILEFIGREGD